MSVLVDTSALYAIVDRDDQHHDQAASYFVNRADEDLLTHNYVIVESSALVGRRLGASAMRDLLEQVIPTLRVLWVDEELHQVAVAGAVVEPSGPVSLVDRVSFELMRRHAIGTAFAFDRAFTSAGFRTVP